MRTARPTPSPPGPPDVPPRRPDPRPARTRRTILDAAGALVAEQGVEDTTIAEVADRAQVAIGSIYAHFGSKENLVLELIELLSEPRFASLEEARSERTPQERVKAVGEALVQFAIDEPVAYAAWVGGHLASSSASAAAATEGDAAARLKTRLDAVGAQLRADLGEVRRDASGEAAGPTELDEDAMALVALWTGIAGSVARRDGFTLPGPTARRLLERTALILG